ncbi:MAG: hypothetical protein COU06_02100 [Candidatus Harrisonbacteria bacterium CG10_big_fil_rev_8_21_14_0_10_38_8]|uniref:Segregation and condensation protein A n=1 Tax=Candidatus Harrisonbacteria bacterium CG10_big_fil_rev_8_21_14_0_10_38_8 TaxID=1974582 RepID=A0A2M6WJR1_9BACT|nr:MAG: hypothetical protein COU06_02100 [Candidatus Harrisonbacteria bacterium CG10_big_fil_rev_8_21_14_0_10_38_8]
MSFNVSIEQFNGPMHKLLELIEEKELMITDVSLGAVTNDFIAYVEKLGEEVNPGLIADFVVIAGRLLLIKSKVLIPSLELTEEESSDIVDLERRLKLYKEYKEASKHVLNSWGSGASYGRKLFANLGEQSFFYPPKDIQASDLLNSIHLLYVVLQGVTPQTKSMKNSFVTLQQRIEELSARITKELKFSMRGRVGAHERQEIIVSFLAVLHMLANKMAIVEQNDEFGDIIITKQE